MNQLRAFKRLACLLLSVPCLAFGSDDGKGRPARLVGVFYPTITSYDVDPVRCPDPSHPFLLTFAGSAQTTLGHAQFTQSHCEGPRHTSFRRGLQTVTFDDGWQLFGTYEGDLIATPTTPTDALLIASGRYRNTGGTGPYEGVRGSGLSAGTVDTNTGAAVIAVSGSL